VSPDGDTRDRATALTLVTPLRPGGRVRLRFIFWLANHLPLARWTLLRLRLIHYARWTIVSRPRPHLFFESNFNGTPDAYVEAFSYVFPRGMRAIWRSSRGFPGAVPVESLRAWIRLWAREESHYYCAYPEASTKQILAALEVRRRLREFAPRVVGMGPDEFTAEYERLVSDLQLEI
jgi:hypothetical protein